MYKACILPKEIERLNELTPLEILQESAQLHLSLKQHIFSMGLRLEQEIERNGKLEAMLSKAKSEEDQKIAEATKAYYAEIETFKEQKMKAGQEISSLKRELEKRKYCLAEIKSTVAKFQSDFEL
ncbi:hypothetical protein ACJIZ3_020804 [Penstemon smallii]|uniref:Uncharacterized protein n=1 Tax=Penstemon smallii TaxID=265156 RepID=A0ABD3SJW5_9LAMI